MDIGGLVYSFFNSPGPGGVVIMVVFGGALILYVVLTRWILAGGKEELAAQEAEQALSQGGLSATGGVQE